MVTDPLVTLDEAQDQLRRPDEDSVDILRKAAAATQIVLNWLRFTDDDVADAGWDQDTAPDDVKVAILMLLGELYGDRGDGEIPTPPSVIPGDLPSKVTRYIAHRRKALVVS